MHIDAIDLNGDSLPDLVLSLTNGGDFNTEPDQFYTLAYLQFIRNNGDGTWTDVTQTALPQSNVGKVGNGWYKYLRVVDLNNDGVQDLVAIGDGNPGVVTFMNDGQGKFTEGFRSPAGFGYGEVTDVNGDGLVDIITSNTNASDVEIWINKLSNKNIYKTIFGTDQLSGSNNDDLIQIGTGFSQVNGRNGYDTLSFTKSASDYKLSFIETGLSVEDQKNKSNFTIFSNTEKLQFTDRAVIIESQFHGSYADLPTELYQFFITAFNAAPGVTYMDQLAEAYRYGLSVKQIVDIFTTKKQFTDVYSPSLSHSDLATQLVNNIVKNSASTSAKTEAISDIKDALDIGWTVGDVIYTVFGNLAHKDLSDPNWGNTAKQFNNEIAVAKFYTEVLNQSTTDLETLRDVIQPVTQFTDVSTDSVLAQLIGVALMSGGTFS
jgi:hypothetical protein